MTTNDTWVPFYARGSEAGAADFDCLFPGVPSWMRESLWNWLAEQLSTWVYSPHGGNGGYWDPDMAKIREVERICRVDSKWTGRGHDYSDRVKGLETLREALYSNDDAFLTAVDLYLSRNPDVDSIKAVQIILEDSSSKWRIGQINSRTGLVERVDETVQRAADELIRKGERPGKLLAEAWQHAFAMQRNPSSAYRCAVRAVEVAAAPVLTPRDPQPSLGKMITAFRDGMRKWRFAFTVDSAVDPKSVLLQMMQLLWTNDYARHVNADPAVPLNVGQEEAESAVILALTLINWFTSGAITQV
ncbi:MAG TPA: hypothetical protein VIY52_06975 [Streptosporangiaceae bacterium]